MWNSIDDFLDVVAHWFASMLGIALGVWGAKSPAFPDITQQQAEPLIVILAAAYTIIMIVQFSRERAVMRKKEDGTTTEEERANP